MADQRSERAAAGWLPADDGRGGCALRAAVPYMLCLWLLLWPPVSALAALVVVPLTMLLAPPSVAHELESVHAAAVAVVVVLTGLLWGAIIWRWLHRWRRMETRSVFNANNFAGGMAIVGIGATMAAILLIVDAAPFLGQSLRGHAVLHPLEMLILCGAVGTVFAGTWAWWIATLVLLGLCGCPRLPENQPKHPRAPEPGREVLR